MESGKILVEGTDRVTSRCDHARRAISIRSLVRWVVVATASLGLTVAFMAGGGQSAQAEPPLTVAEAKARIAQLETDASAIDQEYVEISEQLAKGRAKLKLKQADVKAQAKRVERLKFQVGQVALAQFQNRNLDTAAQLFVTSDTEGFLSQISTVEKVSENQNSVLQEYQQQQAALADIELTAKTDLAALAEQEKQLKSLRTASDKKIAEAKAVMAKLSREEQRKIAAEERRAAADAQARGRVGHQNQGQARQRQLRRRSGGHRREWQGRPRPRLRPGPARQAVPLRLRRAERVRLLGSDLRRLEVGRGEPASLLAQPVRRRQLCLPEQPAAG